ncbi:hypothetical protein H6761_02240 [Candidatus Nomurabacteria bacterium]|nr:hypothetical protein [Candidatus Nomurabacteria bacterium]
MTSKYKTKQNVYGKIVAFFLILVIAAIFIIFHFALAKVTIKIYSQVKNLEYSSLVELWPENSLEVSADKILGKVIHQEFELSVSVPSQATAQTSEKAGGYVTIINNYSKDQALVATTRLLTPDNKLYRLQKKVIVPAGQSIEAWAEADKAGAEYEISESKMIIPGLWEGLQDKIYAETKGMSLSGQPVYQVSEESLAQAEEKIKADSSKQALDLINLQLPQKLQIKENRLFLEYQTIESSKLGEQTNETTLTQKIKVSALVFDEETLLEIAKNKFIENLSSTSKLVEFLPETFSYQIIEIYPEKEQAVIETKLSAKVSSKQHLLEINKEELIGKTADEINQYLNQFTIDQAEIEFFPFWVNKVPKFQDHIIIE